MQQPCHKCGYLSDRPTRFCRRCGTQLFVENEASSATTRQYVAQQTADPPANPYDAPYQSPLAQSRFAQERRVDYQPPDTSQLYRGQTPQNYPNYPPNYQPTREKQSGAWKWVMITLFCVLLVGGGIGAMMISAIRATHNPGDTAPVTEPPVEVGIVPPAPPAPPAPPGGEAPIDLGKYKYPGAIIDNQVRVLGNEVLNMRTRDSFDDVKKFYQLLIGEPVIESNEDGAQKLVFQSAGQTSVLVSIQPDDTHFGHMQIVVVRSGFQFPKLDSK